MARIRPRTILRAGPSAIAGGSGSNTVTGTGALALIAAIITGAAKRLVKGTSSLLATASAIAGASKRTVKGTAIILAAVAAISGSSKRTHPSSGALASSASAISGGDAGFYALPSSYTTIWNPGLNSIGGIPTRTTVYTTINASTYGNGSSEASGGIQTAIDNCPVGQIVDLSAGTFLMNNYVTIPKGITLRGAGPASTILIKTNGAVADSDHHGEENDPIIIIAPNRFSAINNSTATNLTANGVKGSYSVVVSSGTGFAAGQFVLLDCDEYNAGSYIGLPNRNGVPISDTIWATDRSVYMKHNPTEDIIDDPFPDSLTWFSRSGRNVCEIKKIVSVSGTTITFSSPLHTDYPTSRTAQLTRYTDAHVQLAGVESLKVVGGGNGNIRFGVAAFCWAKDIDSSVWYDEAFAMTDCFGIEIRHSYIHDAAFASPGGIGYAISQSNGTSEILLEDCIIVGANKIMVARCCGAGSVIGYNYCQDGYIVYNQGFQEIGINASHMVGSHHVLFEGNECFNYDSDNTHGNAVCMTIHRNHLTGRRLNYSDIDNARCVGLNFGSWWHGFTANVLGNSGAMSGWNYQNTATPWSTNQVWELGYQSGRWEQEADPKVLSTVIRDGNYDYVSNQVRWCGTGISNSTNTTPPSVATHKDSLYLNAKPSFFGANAWPWVTPESGTKLHTLPAKARYDANTPFA